MDICSQDKWSLENLTVTVKLMNQIGLVNLCAKGVDKISPNSNFSQQYLPEVLNWGQQGAIYNFLSGKILEGWLIYLDFQKIERKKLKQEHFCASFSFWRSDFVANVM